MYFLTFISAISNNFNLSRQIYVDNANVYLLDISTQNGMCTKYVHGHFSH